MVDGLVLLAEFLGTFLLTLSVFASGGSWWVVGGTLALIILLIGKLSGAHVNPAISAAVYFKGALSLQELAAYVACQVAGGVSSLYVYRIFA
jgi:aquaporin Z